MASDDDALRRLRALIDELAAAEAQTLLEEARADARAHVRAVLSEALAQAMLDHVGAGLERAHGRPTSAPGTPERTSQTAATRAPLAAGETALYVYGVIAADAAPTITDSVPAIRVLRGGPLAAVARDVALEDFGEVQLRAHLADMTWVEATARDHEDVLDQICRRTTVVPMRMCTVYRSADGVREMLAREAEALADALGRLDGKSEWGVKVFAAAHAHARARADADDDADDADDAGASARPASGAAYMERRRRARDAREDAAKALEQAAAEIHASFSEGAVDAVAAPPQRPEASGRSAEMILNGVYLVRDDDQDAFDQLLEVLRERFAPAGLVLERTGPWPAYNFVPGAIGAAW